MPNYEYLSPKHNYENRRYLFCIKYVCCIVNNKDVGIKGRFTIFETTKDIWLFDNIQCTIYLNIVIVKPFVTKIGTESIYQTFGDVLL